MPMSRWICKPCSTAFTTQPTTASTSTVNRRSRRCPKSNWLGRGSSFLVRMKAPRLRKSKQSIQAKERRHADAENHGEGTHRLGGVDFRFAGPAVLENDGRLADLAASPAAAIQHFLLKR